MKDAKYGPTVGEFFAPDMDKYLDRGGEINNKNTVGRIDTTRVVINETLLDPVRAVLGLGVGNTMDSALGPQFSGEYSERYAGVTVFMALALFYTPVQTSIALSTLFFYFSGLVAAERMRLVAAQIRGIDRVAAPTHRVLGTDSRVHA